MKILKILPGKKPEIINSDDVFNDAKEIINGYVEFFRPFDDDVVILCDEEGKINGAELNRGIYDENDELVDIIAGPFVIAGCGKDWFDLTDEQIKKYYDRFEFPERFVRKNKKIEAIHYTPINF